MRVLVHDDKLGDTYIDSRAIHEVAYRGGRKPPDVVFQEGIQPIMDGRFEEPTIIRDCWREKGVMTPGQTKSTVSVSRHLDVALEYGYGNYVYILYVAEGVDVRADAYNHRKYYDKQGDYHTGHRLAELITDGILPEHIICSVRTQQSRDKGFGYLKLYDLRLNPTCQVSAEIKNQVFRIIQGLCEKSEVHIYEEEKKEE